MKQKGTSKGKRNSTTSRSTAGSTTYRSKIKVPVDNPFDKFANSKKKHEVINRRVKGEDRNVGRAKKKALESRRNRLLVDYQSIKKSNNFSDR